MSDCSAEPEPAFVAPAPIVSRLYQVISDANAAFNTALVQFGGKNPFPFPWAQICIALLGVFTVVAPLVLAAWCEGAAVVAVAAFVVVGAYAALNETCRALEDPFGHPPNDIPLGMMQRALNRRLLRLGPAGDAAPLGKLKADLIGSGALQRRLARDAAGYANNGNRGKAAAASTLGDVFVDFGELGTS